MNQKQKSRLRGLGPRFAYWPVYLAVTGPLTALGVLLGAVGHTLWPGLDRVLAQAAAGLLGFALGVAWCLRVGRRWVEEDEAGGHRRITAARCRQPAAARSLQSPAAGKRA